MEIDFDEAKKFLNFLFQNCPDGGGNIDLRHRDSDGKVKEEFIGVDHIEQIAYLLAQNKHSDWWYGVALRNGHDGTKEAISLMPAVHLEHDNLTPEIDREIGMCQAK